MWLNSMFIPHEDLGCLDLHLKLHLGGDPAGDPGPGDPAGDPGDLR